LNRKHLLAPVVVFVFAINLLVELDLAQAKSSDLKSSSPAAASMKPDVQEIMKFSQDGTF